MIRLPLDYEMRTKRLCLRIPREEDIQKVFTASQFPGFTDGMLWDPPANLEELRGPYERSVQQWIDSIAYQFSIDFEGELVGRIALRPSDTEGVLDIGYWTHPDHYGKGFMTEAVKAILVLGFETMGADAIIAETAVWNKASQRVLEKLGFRIIDVVKDGFVKGDSVCDDIIFRLDR